MDWRNKRIDREAVCQAQRDLVLNVACPFAAESLAGWQVADTADGFEARGDSASHTATAKFRIKPAPSGTKVALTLMAERAGQFELMLFDVSSYYDGQIRKWLEGVGCHIQQGGYIRHPAGVGDGEASASQGGRDSASIHRLHSRPFCLTRLPLLHLCRDGAPHRVFILRG
jgi:hypothetical protein